MRKGWFWLPTVGLALLLAALPPSRGLAGEAEQKASAPATEEKKTGAPPATKTSPPPEKAAAEKPAGLVGTIVAVVPESRTLVVDVPLGKDVLRIGAEVTKKTRIEAGGAEASFDSLKPGARVRINFRRIRTGDEAISVEVLGGPKG